MTGPSGTPRKGKAMSEREELVKDWVKELGAQYGSRQHAAMSGRSADYAAANKWMCIIADKHWHEIIAALEAQTQQEPVAEKIYDGWFRVEVTDSKGQVVAIETEMLAGRNIGDEEDLVIRHAIQHLSSFVGACEPPAPQPGVREGMLRAAEICDKAGEDAIAPGQINGMRERNQCVVLASEIRTRAAEQVNAEGPAVGCARPSAPGEHKTVSRTDPSAPQSEQTHVRVPDPGELWSFCRKLLSQGKDIHLDHEAKSYEQYSARLDAAARERGDELEAMLRAATGKESE